VFGLSHALIVARSFASSAPALQRERRSEFMSRFKSGAILDEVQRCQHLLSWLQCLVDERGRTRSR
jgi:hypothetical protein